MNDDLLVTWKDIAAYLKCSVRKAQRLEREHLPVKRISNTKAVWASKVEIDQWLKRQSTQTSADPSPRQPKGQFQFPGQMWIVALFLVMTVTAALSSAYTLTVVLFTIEAMLLAVTYVRLPDTWYLRALVGAFLVAGLSYALTATSLPAVISGAVNMTTLPPAFGYPFVGGLRFIPVPIVISVILIIGKFERVQIAFLVSGSVLIVATTVFGFLDIQKIWRADLAIRWTLLAGELFIGAVNVGLLVLGYGFFKSSRTRGPYVFISQCGIACVLIALTAAINSRHWTDLTHSYLDVLSPVAYKVRNPDAATDLRMWLKNHEGEAGKDLLALSHDPEFLHALESKAFYRQDFDEPLQVSRRAVIFGFRDISGSTLRRPQFLLIRFPADLAAALRFEPI